MLTFVLGTRPEAIKVGPVVAELKTRDVAHSVLLTGQHTTLLAGTPVESDLSGATSLGIASDGNVLRWLTTMRRKLTQLWAPQRPKVVVVQGDTMSAWAAAKAADGLEIPVAHIEAGVRSHDVGDPWPEEHIRTEISRIATWHLAATDTAAANLYDEGYDPATVTVTGNTIVSAMARYAPSVHPISRANSLILVTLHRRELQHGDNAQRLYNALQALAAERPHLQFVWPTHPAFEKRLQRGLEPLNLLLGAPVSHPDFLRLLAHSSAILTDSGGAVEEAATLGVPTGILRAVNDRPEAEAAGIAKRFEPTPLGLEEALKWWPSVARRPSAVFGTVGAAAKVAHFLAEVA